MKLIDRYEFTNGRAFETWYLNARNLKRMNKPECDVIMFDYGSGQMIMRPDEALIQARMLIDAVRRVTEGYSVDEPQGTRS